MKALAGDTDIDPELYGIPLMEDGDGSLEQHDISSALTDAHRDYRDRIYYLRFPSNYDELMEFVDLCVSKLKTTTDGVFINFDIDLFREDIRSEYDMEVFDIDNYLSDS